MKRTGFTSRKTFLMNIAMQYDRTIFGWASTAHTRPTVADRAIAGPATKVISSIQYLRAIAAILVVFHHARNPLPWLYNPISSLCFGGHGVDIFFVMSGFIMFDAARHERPVEFARRRVLRIVPLYWLATISWLGYELALGDKALDFGTAKELLKSLFFVPYSSGVGHIWPLLVPGWTLNYEMFFYLLFGIGLATGRVVSFVTAAVIGLCAVGAIFHFRDPRWLTYTNIGMLKFVAGIFIAMAYRRYSFRKLAFCLPLGFAILFLSDLLAAYGIPLIGMSAVLIIVGALSLEKQGAVPRIPVLELLGNASYAIYLFHIRVLAAVALFVRAYVPSIGILQVTAMIILAVCGGVGVGIFVHLWVEKPLMAILRPRRSSAIA